MKTQGEGVGLPPKTLRWSLGAGALKVIVRLKKVWRNYSGCFKTEHALLLTLPSPEGFNESTGHAPPFLSLLGKWPLSVSFFLSFLYKDIFHTIHPFKVHGSIVLSIFTELSSHQYSQFYSIFNTSPQRNPAFLSRHASILPSSSPFSP